MYSKLKRNHYYLIFTYEELQMNEQNTIRMLLNHMGVTIYKCQKRTVNLIKATNENLRRLVIHNFDNFTWKKKIIK